MPQRCVVNATIGTSIKFWNPLTYRGYIQDVETGFYYLQSRYYDPVTHRFLNADGLASTGQGFLGYNMFAYCNNNPAVFQDADGESRECVGIDKIGGGGEAALCGLGLLVVGWGVYAGICAPTHNDGAAELGVAMPMVAVPAARADKWEKEKTKVQAIVTTAESRSRKQAFFPENPFEFAPKGLYMHIYVSPGTGTNGGIVKWELPGTSIAIFEWNEDYKYGPHYHIMNGVTNKHDGIHWKIGDMVPEPFNTIYFGGEEEY